MVALVAVLCAPITAQAQDAPALRQHQFALGGGLAWAGGYDIGDATAQLRGTTTAPTFTLFTAKSRITPAISPELHVGFAVTRRIAVEFGFAVSRPHVGVSIAGDQEAPAQELVGEQLNQYLIGGGVTWQFPLKPSVRIGPRLAPFVSGGAAFLRQLHEDRTLAETGQVYYAGGGARYFLRGGHGAGLAYGLRGDARVNFRIKGIDFEDRMRIYPTFGLSAFVGF
jgi:hypothetical protein